MNISPGSASVAPPSPLFERIGGRAGVVQLLRHFYADVRQHQLLAPIFNEHIHNWPAHIEHIADFWSTVTSGPPKYAGPMALKHVPLGIREEHFQAWLGLWEHNCRAWIPADCATELIELAHLIASRLRMICGLLPASPTSVFKQYVRPLELNPFPPKP